MIEFEGLSEIGWAFVDSTFIGIVACSIIAVLLKMKIVDFEFISKKEHNKPKREMGQFAYSFGVMLLILGLFVFSQLIFNPKLNGETYKVLLEKSERLSDLRNQLGYGAGIHNFKNYILRKDTIALNRFENTVKSSFDSGHLKRL